MHKKYFEMVQPESSGYIKIICVLALEEFRVCFFSSPNIFDHLLEYS